MDALKKLAELSDLYNYQNLLAADKQSKRDEILKPVVVELMDLDAEFEDKETAVAEKIEKLETELKAAAEELGQGIKDANIGASVVYARGGPKWDDQKLRNWIINHPEYAMELMRLRSETKPKISVRQNHNKE